MNDSIGTENQTLSYFRTRRASLETSAIILTHPSNPLGASLRSSQLLLEVMDGKDIKEIKV